MRIAGVLAFASLLGTPALADDRLTVGGDAYLGGTTVTLADPSPRDVFVSGFMLDVDGRVDKDVHAAGCDVDINGPVGGDVYSAGCSIELSEPIAEDLTAAGFSIFVHERATIGGNTRLAAASMTIDAPIAGSLVASAGTLTLNGTVAGDALLTAGTMNFGANAKVGGTLTYYAVAPIAIPASVAPPERVRFAKLEVDSAATSARETAERAVPGAWFTLVGVLSAFALVITFLIAAAAVLFAFAPRMMEGLKDEALNAPVKTMALGILGLSMSVGLVPVSAITLIGIPLIPIAILLAMALWIMGYLTGAYALAARMTTAFRAPPAGLGGKLIIVGLTVIVLAVLNFIPIIGWLINLAIVFLGLGTIMMRAARAITRQDGEEEEALVILPEVPPAAPVPPGTPRARRSRS
jgi:hypothetical protein